MNSSRFWRWFEDNIACRRDWQAGLMTEMIREQLMLVNSDLGVEVGRDEFSREMIITAAGNQTLFPIVYELVQSAPTGRGWQFIALKPARGFDFSIEIDGLSMDAKQLLFEPLQSSRSSTDIGIRIYVPPANYRANQLDDLVWIIVETGVGEERASCIAHLDVAAAPQDAHDYISICDLGNYLDWTKSHGSGDGKSD